MRFYCVGIPVHSREREVSLLIQVPGCLLEIPGVQVVAGAGIFARRRAAKPVVLTSRISGVRKCREMSEIPAANADILEFPGFVDKKGVLRVYNWSGPGSKMQDDSASVFKETAMSSRSGLGKWDGGCPPSDPLQHDLVELSLSLLNAWVLRESDPVFLLSQVQHAYIYLVPLGEEHLPPKIFGCIPLTLSRGTKAAFDKQGAGVDPHDWPPPEAFASEKAESESETEDVIETSEDSSHLVCHRCARGPCSLLLLKR